jgi:hypothetical protein
VSAYDNSFASRSNGKALAGNVGGQARVQEVLSPRWSVAAGRAALGGVIGLDPCAPSTRRLRFAKHNACLSRKGQQLDRELLRLHGIPKHKTTAKQRKRMKEVKRLLKWHYLGGSLKRSWGPLKRTAFVNPPYAFLEEWMKRCAREAAAGRQVVGFWPARTHRKWWWKLLRGAEIVFLNYRVIFEGHKNAFPQPMVMVTWNCTLPSLGAMELKRVPSSVRSLRRIASARPSTSQLALELEAA